jgi:hypothetical protein
MIKIAHRGNIDGSNPELENNPDYIERSVDLGYDVEVDVWVKDGLVYFGHDKPQYLVGESFLLQIGHAAWFHCKNLEALEFFNTWLPHLNYFWHESDSYTVTSCSNIWAYPGVDPGKSGVLVMPEARFKDIRQAIELYKPSYVCTDYVSLL